MGLVTTKKSLRDKLKRAFEAGRTFSEFGVVDENNRMLSDKEAFEELIRAEYIFDPSVDLRESD
jgi:hypothetical protein